MMDITYCEECREFTPYSTNVVDAEHNIHGVVVKYKGYESYCSECGHEVWVSKLRDKGLDNLKEAYNDKG